MALSEEIRILGQQGRHHQCFSDSVHDSSDPRIPSIHLLLVEEKQIAPSGRGIQGPLREPLSEREYDHRLVDPDDDTLRLPPPPLLNQHRISERLHRGAALHAILLLSPYALLHRPRDPLELAPPQQNGDLQ